MKIPVTLARAFIWRGSGAENQVHSDTEMLILLKITRNVDQNLTHRQLYNEYISAINYMDFGNWTTVFMRKVSYKYVIKQTQKKKYDRSAQFRNHISFRSSLIRFMPIFLIQSKLGYVCFKA